MKRYWILIAGIVFTVAVVALKFLPERSFLLPEELAGIWTTSAPKYGGRFFELSRVTIIFGTGGDRIAVYFVKKTEESVSDKRILYTVHGRNREGLEDEFSFYYNTVDRTIRLKNQKSIVWTKKNDSS
jgi:hypothetical protein